MSSTRFIFATALIAALVLSQGCVVIEDGEVGVSKSFGSISDEPVGQGIALQFPVVRQVEGAKVGLTHVIGLGSACAIHILEKTAA